MLFNKLNVKAIILMLVSVAMAMAAAPKIVFVKSSTSAEVVTGDPNTEFRLVGAQYEFYILALNEDDSPCFDCNFNLALGDQTSKGITILSGNEVVNGRATVIIQSQRVYEKCDNADRSMCGKDTTAVLHVVGPNAALTSTEYTNLQFLEPPVPIPQFADIYDVHGVKPSEKNIEMNINGKDKNGNDYFNSNNLYLDGIADSLVVYYHRTFPNRLDSLMAIPHTIVVYWDEDEQDSTVFDSTEIRRGLICGSDIGIGARVNTNLDPEICANKISLSTYNKNRGFSKGVKTSGVGKITSWATFTKGREPNRVSVTQDYAAPVYDRVAPIIVAARAIAVNNSSGKVLLKLTFSEPVQKTDVGAQQGENVFSFFVNSENKHEFRESIDVAQGITYGNKFAIEQTFVYNQDREFPQAGDYIHFRAINGIGLIKDQSEYSNEGLDAIRSAAATLAGETSTTDWNIAPAYDSYVSDPSGREPSPWVLIEKMTSSSSTSGKSSSSAAASSNSKANSERPDFYVKMIGPFEFEIVMDESVPSLAKKYAVMDMKGQVLSIGELNDKNAYVKVPTRGAYVVKLGLSYQRVNIR